MNTPIRCLLVAFVASLSTLVFDGPGAQPQSASAQGFGRGRDGGSGGESREERRDRYRRSFGGGGGDRGGGEWRGRGGDDDRRGDDRRGDDRRGDDRSRGSSPSGGNSGGGSSSSPDTKSSGAASTSFSTAEWAKKIVEEKDKNGNHWLDGEELKGLGGTVAKSDLNNDGVITVDELVQHSTAAAAAAAPATTTAPTTSDSKSSGGGDSSRRDDGDRRKGEGVGGIQRVFTGSAGGLSAKEGDKRRTYRFSTAADRMPPSVPSFFSRDKNGDGQVSMSEYSRTWSKSTVAEFRKYDLNDDGLITAKEAAKPAASGG